MTIVYYSIENQAMFFSNVLITNDIMNSYEYNQPI